MLENNCYIQSYSIDQLDPNYLKYVEVLDDKGKIKWFIEDSFNNKTPLFDNKKEIIVINKKSCMFLGRNNGITKLYVVERSLNKNQELYKEIELEGNPKEIVDIDPFYAIINSEKGNYFFDKKNLKRTSEMFDNISAKLIDGETVYIFEQEINDKRNGVCKKIIGNVSLDGKIGKIVYDDSLNCLRTSPIVSIKDSYDIFDYYILYSELEELSKKKEYEKTKHIKNLVKINKY